MARKKKVNLKYQLTNAVDRCTKIAVNKHAMKGNGRTNESTVYSYEYKRALNATAVQLAEFVKSRYPEVRDVAQLNCYHVQAFLEEKALTNNENSLRKIFSNLKKLDKILTRCYPHHREPYTDFIHRPISIVGDMKLRDIAMTREHYQLLLTEMMKSRSEAKYAVWIAGRLGLRVGSFQRINLSKDYNKEERTLRIYKDKGGRTRVLNLTDVDIEILEQIKSIQGSGKIIHIQKGSINKAVNRYLKRLGLEEYINCKTSLHAIRKMVATEMYYENIAQGMKPKQAWDAVSHFLGHGDNRRDLRGTYVCQAKEEVGFEQLMLETELNEEEDWDLEAGFEFLDNPSQK